MRRLLLSLVILAGCTRAGTPENETPREEPAPPAVAPAPPPVKTAPPAKVATRVELTAVTLADDCGGSAPWSAPPAPATSAAPITKSRSPATHKQDSADEASFAKGKRRCEQTSMQLAIIAGEPTALQVKSVELFDDAGKSLGTLTASKPTKWSDASSTYEAWDEQVAAGTASVSYVLAQPKWDQIGNRWNKTYTLKTVISIGGVETAAQKDVTLTAPTSLPPNVKT